VPMRKVLLTDDEIADFCLSLSMLVHAGVDHADACVLLHGETPPSALRDLLRQMIAALDAGATLADAVRQTGAFPAGVSAMLHVGQITGRLEAALTALANYHTQRSRTQKRLRSALLYPSLLAFVMLCVIVVLLTQVLPIFQDVYAALGGSLTGLAGGLLQLGMWLHAAMPVLCVLLALVLLAVVVVALSSALRAGLVQAWTRRFGMRGISRRMAAARFVQALTMGIHSGLTPEGAVQAAAEILDGHPLRANAQRCLAALDAGASLADALGMAELLPPAQVRLLSVGMRGGYTDAVLDEVARAVQQDADDALERRLSQIEPALVIACSVLVGVILLSVLLPLTRIMRVIG